MTTLFIENEGDRDRVYDLVASLRLTQPDQKNKDGSPKKPIRYRVEIVIDRPTRTKAQNKLLWKWYGEIQKWIFETTGENHGSEDLHEYFTRKILPTNPVIDPVDGSVIGYKRTETKDLSIEGFSEYLNRIEVYAQEDLCMTLTHPNDCYWEAVGAPYRERPSAG